MLLLAPGCRLGAQSAQSLPAVQRIEIAEPPPAAARAAAALKATLTVGAQDGWLDSGLIVAAGDRISAPATGTLELGDGRRSTQAGVARGWKDLLRQFPLNTGNTGALLGRVGDDPAAVPFALADGTPAIMPGSGHLYLRTNLADDQTAQGAYTVRLQVVPGAMAAVPASDAALASVGVNTFTALPRRVADRDGNLGDMVNFALIGTEAEVNASFAAAGWGQVDRNVQDAILHGLLATLSHEAYTAMPMSTLYLFGRAQDLSFARGDPLRVAAERHHLRVWKTTQTLGGRPLWIGSATHDIGFERDERNGDVTHRIDPDVDGERDFLLHSFTAAGAAAGAEYVRPDDPVLAAHTATGGDFHSDGRVVVLDLVARTATSPAVSR